MRILASLYETNPDVQCQANHKITVYTQYLQ